VPDVVYHDAKLAVYVYDCMPSEVSMVEGRELHKKGWEVIRLGRLDILGDVDKFIRKIKTVLDNARMKASQ
jgi:very-short-patch-repair endonuclease